MTFNRIHPITLNLTHKCNLNCVLCNQFITKSDFKYLEKDQLQSISKALEKINFNSIGLSGGEPLLHPEISWIIQHLKSHFPEKELTVITNGLLLNRLSTNDFHSLDRITISWYKGVNDDIVEFYLGHPNVIVINRNYFYDPGLNSPNNVNFSKFLSLICPMKRLFLVGDKAYSCCMANAIERVHKVKDLNVSVNEPDWLKRFHRIPTYKACVSCRFAELSRANTSLIFKCIFQTSKIILESFIPTRKILLSKNVFRWRKARLTKKLNFPNG